MIDLDDLSPSRSPNHPIGYAQRDRPCFQASDNALRPVADDQPHNMRRSFRRDRDRL